MISLLDATPASVMEVLRGERATRPPADCTAAPGVRATLEDALFELLGAEVRAEPLTLSASSLRGRGEGSTTRRASACCAAC